jgi:hypothetical protein
MPAAEAGLQRGTLVMQPADNQFTRRGGLQSKISLPAVVAVANMLAMVLLDSQSTNYDSRNDLRFTDHVQHPVQKQGRPVPKRRLGQRTGHAECLVELERTNRNAGDAMRWTGSPKGENAGCSRVNHFVPRT